MRRTNENPKNAGEILSEFFATHGSPAEVAKEIDDIIFDWIGSNEQDLQDWHKEMIHLIKSVRDLFTDLNATINRD